jgi:hypothetical protein
MVVEALVVATAVIVASDDWKIMTEEDVEFAYGESYHRGHISISERYPGDR